MKYVLIFLVSAFPFITHANYIKVAGTLGSKTTFEETTMGTSTVDMDHKALHPLIVALGMSIGPLALEIEGSIRNNEDEAGLGMTMESQHLGLNIAADITGGKYMVNPYVGGGIVAGLYNLKPADESGFGVAFQVFGGAMFKVTNFFHIGAEIRHFASIRDTAFEIAGTDIELKHKQTSYMLTTALHF